MGGDFIGFFRRHFGENVSEFRIFVLYTVEIGPVKLKYLAIGQGFDRGCAFFPENQGEVSEIVAILQDAMLRLAVIGGNFNPSPADEKYFFTHLAFPGDLTLRGKGLRFQCH